MILYRLPENTLCLKGSMRTRSLMDRTEASDAFNAGSIPVECRVWRDDGSRLFCALRPLPERTAKKACLPSGVCDKTFYVMFF